MELFKTDFYQLSMCLAYFMLNEHNHDVVFEAFVRKIDPKVNPDKTHYKFYGNEYVKEFIDNIVIELSDMKKVTDLFCQIVLPKAHPALRNSYYKTIKNMVMRNEIRTDFDVNIYPDNGIVQPYIPVFQYVGPKWIGQLIETRICLLINSKVGANTNFVSPAVNLVYPNRNNIGFFDDYMESLDKKADSIRRSTSRVLLEAGYRRAISDEIANEASSIAIRNGWNGSSNVGAYLAGLIPLDRIGGTMAHSFVMSHRTEEEAFIKWNQIWPNSTILIDTYDCVNAAKILINNNIVPKDVRIDSDPIDQLARDVQKTFKDAGWNLIGSFLSGDFDEKKISKMIHIDYQKIMVGTKYVNHGIAEDVNCGFVYKIMRVTDEFGTYFPEKKSNKKQHYNGLKKLSVVNNRILMERTENMNMFTNDLLDVDPEIQPYFSF